MTDSRREVRHFVRKQARYRTGSGLARDVIVTDLSTKGCRFTDRFCNLRLDSYLSIRIGNIGPLGAVVKWVRGSDVGIEFERPIHSSILDHMRAEIDGWAEGHMTANSELEDDSDSITDNSESYINIKIRSLDIEDIILVMKKNNISFPLKNYSDISDIFYMLLEQICEDNS